jgi:hypothetical protein
MGGGVGSWGWGWQSEAPEYALFAIINHAGQQVGIFVWGAGRRVQTPERACNPGRRCADPGAALGAPTAARPAPNASCATRFILSCAPLRPPPKRDYEAMCRDYYTLQFMDPSVDTRPIAPALQVGRRGAACEAPRTAGHAARRRARAAPQSACAPFAQPPHNFSSPAPGLLRRRAGGLGRRGAPAARPWGSSPGRRPTA